MTERFTCPRDPVRGQGASWRPDRTCIFCGSMHADDFMAAASSGVRLVPTDKNYKVYVGTAQKKFYFQHLTDAQRDEFVKLMNGGKMVLATPGYFYTLPYFVGPAPK